MPQPATDRSDEQEFRRHAEETIATLYRLLLSASDDYAFDVHRAGDALTVEFERPPAKFVISPNGPSRQIWFSARGKSHKLDWDIVEASFTLGTTGETLKEVVEQAISQQLGEDVSL